MGFFSQVAVKHKVAEMSIFLFRIVKDENPGLNSVVFEPLSLEGVVHK